MKKFILRGNSSRDGVKQGLYAALKALPTDKNYQVAISPYKEDKTAEQRAFFHILCSVFSEETGYTKDEIKMYCKEDCFGSTQVTIGGVTREVVKSSESAKRDEYSALIETCYRLAAQAGIVLPLANRYGR